MITRIYPNDDWTSKEDDNWNPINTSCVSTQWCWCCSSYLWTTTDKDEIIKELKKNIEITKEACDLLWIDFNSLLD